MKLIEGFAAAYSHCYGESVEMEELVEKFKKREGLPPQTKLSEYSFLFAQEGGFNALYKIGLIDRVIDDCKNPNKIKLSSECIELIAGNKDKEFAREAKFFVSKARRALTLK